MMIQGQRIGSGQPCYIVAEISANHNQSYERAARLIEAAKRAGANAIKVQTYTADTLTIDSEKAWFRIPGNSPWGGKTLYELYGEAYTPWEWQPKLQRVARDVGIHFFSTPFDVSAVDFLETLDVPAYKVASFEIIDVGLLRRIARTAKPVILSTGMASLGEIEQAVAVLRGGGGSDIALLKCTSAYPASPASMNLQTITHLRSAFGTEAGLSDHTLGAAVAVAAVALGASIVEKHFILSRSEGGPDSAFSMEPDEFREMVTAIHNVEEALGAVSYGRTKEEESSICFRRSLFVIQNVKAGEAFTEVNVRSIRPGYGLAPIHLDDVLGKVAVRDIERGTPLSWNLVSGLAR